MARRLLGLSAGNPRGCPVISMAEKRAHCDEIRETAQLRAEQRTLIDQRAARYDVADLLVPSPSTTHRQEA